MTSTLITQLAPRVYTLAQATVVCGYRRVATMREKHLRTECERRTLGHAYDEQGRVVLDANAVDELARALRDARLARGNWRLKNLKEWGSAGARPVGSKQRRSSAKKRTSA